MIQYQQYWTPRVVPLPFERGKEGANEALSTIQGSHVSKNTHLVCPRIGAPLFFAHVIVGGVSRSRSFLAGFNARVREFSLAACHRVPLVTPAGSAAGSGPGSRPGRQ